MATYPAPVAVRLKLARQRLLSALGVGGERMVIVKDGPNGVLIKTDERDVHAPSVYRWKLYRKGWSARLRRLADEYGIGRHVSLNPGDVVLDVGANVGEFAYVATSYGARTFCFEPDPKAFGCLLANTAELKDVHAHNIVVWRENGRVTLNLAPARADSSVFGDKGEKIECEAQTIATLCDVLNISQIGLVKCDAEGAEPEVLIGALPVMNRIAAFAIDTGAERGGARTHEACEELLRHTGFCVIEEKIGTRWMTYGLRQGSSF